MATVTVSSIGEVNRILRALFGALQDFRPVWARLEKVLPGIQKAYWDARFYRGFQHSRRTAARRQRGLGLPVKSAKRREQFAQRAAPAGRLPDYYLKNRPTAGTTATDPYYGYTGSLRRATESLTLREKLRAAVDTALSYRGPIKELRDPVGAIMEEGRRGVSAFDEPKIEARLEQEVEAWLQEVVDGLA